jgi:predicted O-methyltransferase YrrM
MSKSKYEKIHVMTPAKQVLFNFLSNSPKWLLVMSYFFWSRIRGGQYPHVSDGILTVHQVDFLNKEKFKNAYRAGLQVTPHDYRIPWRVQQGIWCANVAIRTNPNGAFIELGTGYGFMMTCILSHLENESLLPEKTILFDSFKKTQQNNETSQTKNVSTHYTDDFELVKKHFQKFKNVVVIKGDLPTTLVGQTYEKGISFLHIDLNNPEVEINSLRHIWDNLNFGAVILIDDYSYIGYTKTRSSFDKFMSEHNQSILTTPSGQGIIIKC